MLLADDPAALHRLTRSLPRMRAAHRRAEPPDSALGDVMNTTQLPPIQLGTVERLVRTLGIVIVALVAAALVVETIRYIIYAGEPVPQGGILMSYADMDNEDSIATWFQGLHLALAGLLAGAWARHDPRRVRWGWWVLGALFFAMSLDELTSMHEKFTGPLRQLLDVDSGPLLFAWVVLGIVVAGVFAVVMVPFLLRLPRPTALRLAVAGAVFIAGALGMEMVGGLIAGSVGMDTLTYRLVIIGEETLEMVGTLLAIRAIGLHFQGRAAAR